MEGDGESGCDVGQASASGSAGGAPWRRGGGPEDSGSTGPSIPPPPPPSLPTTGAIPAQRLNTEIGPRDKGPPAALANAMMKDKKPFTYTPGGIDLFSEIRSPRMAKRLQMNAASEGVTGTPKAAPTVTQSPTQQNPNPLPPAALAAMQPQMAFPVFPSGPVNLKKTQFRPSDMGDREDRRRSSSPQRVHQQAQVAAPHPPPPPQVNMSAAPPPPPPFMQQSIPAHRSQPPPQAQLSPQPQIEPKLEEFPIYTRKSQAAAPQTVGKGSIYIPPASNQNHQAPPPVPRRSPSPLQVQQVPARPQEPSSKPMSKAQAASQNLGSIYIPPAPVDSVQVREKPTSTSSNGTPGTASTDGSSSRTPQLSKAPTPWMNSLNRKPVEVPPYVNPGNVSGMTIMSFPWGNNARSIPIQRDMDSMPSPPAANAPEMPQMPQSPPNEFNKAKAAQHLGRVIPIQIQRQNSQKQELIEQHTPPPGWPRVIPIQMESKGGSKGEPTQSKSLKIVQKAAENELRRLSFSLDDRQDGWQSPKLYDPFSESFGMGFSQPDYSNLFLQNMLTPGAGPAPQQQQQPSQPQRGGQGQIPSRAFKTLQSSLPSGSEQTNIAPSFSSATPNQGGPVMHNIPIQFSNATSPDPVSSPTPANSEQRPELYMGSKIPSRSFKMLQAMTASEDPDASDASSSSTPTPLFSGADSAPFDPSSSSSSPSTPVPGDFMSWYYFWYYVTHYWQGYDMSGYEYPAGWDPENPYCPPELYAQLYPDNYEYDSNNDSAEEYYNTMTENCETPVKSDSELGERPQSEVEEDSVSFSCKTNSAIVEEPSTSTTEDSDATLIEDGILSPPCLIIEEYKSSSENLSVPKGKRFLSTIEELTDEGSSRGSTPNNYNNLPLDDEVSAEKAVEQENVEEDEDEEESDSATSDEDASSASVIENKSASQQSMSVSASASAEQSSKLDLTSSSSSEEEEEDDEENMVAEAVTFRLPLQFSFGKTKSYKDITTVLVGDSEVKVKEEEKEEETETKEELPVENEEVEEDYYYEEEEGDGPVVSFTISLNRQSSREEKSEPEDQKTEEDEVEDEQEIEQEEQEQIPLEESKEEEEQIDFWSHITGAKTNVTASASKKKEDNFTSIEDYWAQTECEDNCDDEEDETNLEMKAQESEVADKNEQFQEEAEADEEELEFKPVQDFWERFGDKTDSRSNRKSSVGSVSKSKWLSTESHEAPIQSFTIPLSHSTSNNRIGTSWDTEFNFWDKSLAAVETRRFSNCFEITEDYESDSGMKSDSGHRHREVRKVRKHRRQKQLPSGLPVLLKKGKPSGSSKQEHKLPLPSEVFQEILKPTWTPLEVRVTNLFESWKKDDRETFHVEEEAEAAEAEEEVELQKSEDFSQDAPENDMKIESEPEADQNETTEAEEKNDASVWSYWDDVEGTEDANNVSATANTEDSFSPEVDVEVKLPTVKKEEKAVEENSVSTSSTSSGSGTTVKGGTGVVLKPLSLKENATNFGIEEEETAEDVTPTQPEKSLPIEELSESIKLEKSPSTCNCQIDDKISRAESLLWRIERFLHESLNFGSSEGDSGVTDCSRPISDVDTDPDETSPQPPLNSTNLLLTTPSQVVLRRPPAGPNSSRLLREQAATNRSNPRKARPHSMILLESSTSNSEFTETLSGTRPRSNSAERRRYQRAKTHSRLFQLLQDESTFDEEEFFDCVSTPLSFLHQAQGSDESASTSTMELHVDTVSISQNQSSTTTAESSSITTQEARRSRLLPLPLKSILTSGNSETPASSPSGSSGVLSPTSPQTRDRLLAGIINEFHLRQNSEVGKAGDSPLGKRFSKFPSKIFKMLQEEFGEEFYQTFNCGSDGFLMNPGDLLMQSHFSHCSEKATTSTSIASSFTIEEFQKEGSTSKSSSGDFLEVPAPNPRKRDFRVPKAKK